MVSRLGKPLLKTDVSLAADILLPLASVAAGVISYTTHRRSLRPSTLLCLYLSVLLLLSIPRMRTICLLDSEYVKEKASIIASTALNTLFLLAEAIERHETPKGQTKQTQGPEEFSSLWNRAAFYWLSTTFLKGYTQILAVEDLPEIDSKLRSSRVREKLLFTWDKCKKRQHLQF